MTERMLMGLLMALFGGLLVGGVVFQWTWLVAGRKYRRLAEAFGPRVPALLYALVGGVMLVLGILGALGVWRGGTHLGTGH